MKKIIKKDLIPKKLKNSKHTSISRILDQMNESRPLPMGVQEFQEWSERIISGALLPGGEEDPIIFQESQRYALANMLLHLGPTESHKPDAYFIHSLRKVAINQVADSIRRELYEKKLKKQVNELTEERENVQTSE